MKQLAMVVLWLATYGCAAIQLEWHEGSAPKISVESGNLRFKGKLKPDEQEIEVIYRY